MSEQEAIAELAPSGRLRAAINVANPTLARLEADGRISGHSVELANALAHKFNLPLDLIRFESAGAVVAAELEDQWDIAFLAIDPARANRLHFTPAFRRIEATYAVPAASSYRSVADLDQLGVRIASSTGAAYDLHLQRSLVRATRLAFANPQELLAAFAAGEADAVAGVRLALENFKRSAADIRILAEPFLVIEQAIATPLARRRAASLLDRFVAGGIALDER